MPCQKCKHATLSDGKPYLIGRPPWTVGRQPYVYTCAGCGQSNSLSASEFRLLPKLTFRQLLERGEGWRVENDLKGAGVTSAQINELDKAGVDFESLHPPVGHK